MQKMILIFIFLCCTGLGFAQNTTITDEQMKKAQQMLNSPEYQQQMKRAIDRMKQQGIDPAKMGNMEMMMNPKMIEAGMGMSACMQKNPGQEGLTRISKKAQDMERQVQAVCKLGEREQANRLQKELSLKMLADPDMIAVRACADQFKDKLNDPSLAEFRKQIDTLSAEKQPEACSK